MIKRIPSMVSKWLSHISSDKEHIDKVASIYNDAENNGFNETVKVSHIIPTRRHRERYITWFNPPFSSNVKTNVGKLFLPETFPAASQLL